MIKKTSAVLAVVFSVFSLIACGSDSDDSGNKGGSGGMTGSTGGNSNGGTGGGGTLPAWLQTCHEYCAKQNPCESDRSLDECYSYKCQFPGDEVPACQNASVAAWQCEMKQADICDEAALETACSAEYEALGPACN